MHSFVNVQGKSLSRRGSSSDIKQENVKEPVKRSHSIGQDSNITSAAARARDMVSKRISSFQQSKKNSTFKEKGIVKTGLSENKGISKSNLKPFNLVQLSKLFFRNKL